MPTPPIPRPALLLPIVLLAGACASGGGPREDAPPPGTSGTTDVVSARLSTTGSDDATRLLSYNVETAYTVTLAATPQQATDAAALVHGALFDRRPAVSDGPPRLVESGPLRSMSTIAGERLAVWFDCGQDAQGMDRANSHRVTLLVRTTIRPAPGGQAALETYLGGEARSLTVNTEPFPCRSTGRLEQRLHAEVARRLTAK